MRIPVLAKTNWKKRVLSLFLAAWMLLTGTVPAFAEEGNETLKEIFGENSSIVVDDPFDLGNNVLYNDMLNEYAEKGYTPADTDPVSVESKDAEFASGVADLREYGDEATGLAQGARLSEDNEWIAYTFNVTKAGLYNIEVEYYVPQNTGLSVTSRMEIDGEERFAEMSNLKFYTRWKDEGEPARNNLDNDVRPKQLEEAQWQTTLLEDGSGSYVYPMEFYFEPGEHTVKFYLVDKEMGFGTVSLVSALRLKSYAELKAEYDKLGYQAAGITEPLQFQAENSVLYKNDPSVRREHNADPAVKPAAYDRIRLNVLGGGGFSRGGQSVTWKFKVEKSGLYTLNLRVNQSYNDGLPSTRQILIDGEIPFAEFAAYSFDYNQHARCEWMSDENGNPYQIYLEAGEHTLTMTVKVGKMNDIVLLLNDILTEISRDLRQITLITGSDPDVNYDYELDKNIPGLMDSFKNIVAGLKQAENMFLELADDPSIINTVKQVRESFEKMVKDPDTIPASMTNINNDIASLSSAVTTIQGQALEVDYIELVDPTDTVVDYRASVWQTIWATLVNFASSFFKDYNSVGSLYETGEVEATIEVWNIRAKEWAELLKQMVDEDFTLNHNIGVKMVTVPASEASGMSSGNKLILAMNSGTAPDVVLGLAAGTPVEYAFREGVMNLNQFDTYEEVASRYTPQMLVPFHFQGNDYGIPETASFTVMFYRKDILSELNMRLPQTWDELYHDTLPVLYQNGMQFMCPGSFNMFLFQNGGDFYNADGSASALDSPEAYAAFKQMCDTFISYGMPVSANFFNMFRTGQIPIGISGHGMYFQLMMAAPELAGKWGFVEIPGVMQEDGTINNTMGGATVDCSVILSDADNPEACWEFIDWWSSASVQETYARNVEAQLGIESRWISANLEAFSKSAFTKEELDIAMDCIQNCHEVMPVLGGYFTGREIGNAWNRVINSGQPIRDALEEAIEGINKELDRKQTQYENRITVG